MRAKDNDLRVCRDRTERCDYHVRPPAIALLSASHQIRREALSIFRITVTDCDARLALALVFDRHKWDVDISVKMCVRLRGRMNWSNLMRWFKMVCEDGAVVLTARGGMAKLRTVIASAH